MAVATIKKFEKTLQFAWRQTNRRDVEMHFPSAFLALDRRLETFDAEWWEPTTAWRREDYEVREFFGGERFGRPSLPVEGPNNPNRLRRELEEAERALHNAEAEQTDAEDRAIAAAERAHRLRSRLTER